MTRWGKKMLQEVIRNTLVTPISTTHILPGDTPTGARLIFLGKGSMSILGVWRAPSEGRGDENMRDYIPIGRWADS
ncbi:hypothetical protein M404DRAFT_1002772 [Pisolithus tinctorius Marx 270]|uniref:Uncharacterized protein n=1 Tax=Pisolithus tinctorius Marx 270 TaxID=870435 RepID=A0A0C3P2U2_PISTI|nr:hypothetical protein M404DRAFT_1002772 [Pisolithus tinctorius Marx 270]